PGRRAYAHCDRARYRESSHRVRSTSRTRPRARGDSKLKINRAPVLTLWGAVVAERLGHGREAALTLGKALAGRNAQSKGRRLGIYHEAPESVEKERQSARQKAGVTWIELAGRRIPVVRGKGGVRAVRDDQPEDPAAIERYLASKFGEDLAA